MLALLTFSALQNHYGKDNIVQSLWLVFLKYSSNPKLKQLNELKKTRRAIYVEKTALSPQDQYAKWTKLNRKFDELGKTIESLETEIVDLKNGFCKKISGLLSVVYWIPMIYFRGWNRKTPVFWLPNGVFPFFIEKLLSWPSAPVGSIGLTQWIFLINAFLGGVLFTYKNLINPPLIQKPEKSTKIATK